MQYKTALLTNDFAHKRCISLMPCDSRDVVHSCIMPPGQHTGLHHWVVSDAQYALSSMIHERSFQTTRFSLSNNCR